MRSKLRCNRLLVENAQTSDEEVNTLCVGRRHTDALVLHGTKKQGCAKTQLWGQQASMQAGHKGQCLGFGRSPLEGPGAHLHALFWVKH